MARLQTSSRESTQTKETSTNLYLMTFTQTHSAGVGTIHYLQRTNLVQKYQTSSLE